MKYEAKAWKETEGACLRNFNEQAQIDSVNGALALRPQIEKIIDQIWEEGFDGIYFIGIGLEQLLPWKSPGRFPISQML